MALAATENGIKSTICMPDGAPHQQSRSHQTPGSRGLSGKGYIRRRLRLCRKLRDETGATFIHPFDDELVIAGQGTIGLEILDQLADVDAVLVPIGGGGLISGVACAIKNLRPDVKVYGVQARRGSQHV